MQFEFPAPVIEIPVKDMSAAIEYYRSNLGFNIDWNADDIGLAGISKGNCRLFLANAFFRRERGNNGPVVIWLNLGSKAEVDELYDVWKSSNAILFSAPESKPWFLHEFTATDLDCNVFRVFYDFGSDEHAQ